MNISFTLQTTESIPWETTDVKYVTSDVEDKLPQSTKPIAARNVIRVTETLL